MNHIKHDHRPIELAMRCVLIVKELAKGDGFYLADLVEVICKRFSVSKATGYRYARSSLDVLCIDYSVNEARNARRRQRREMFSVGGRTKQHYGMNGSAHA
jgi:hypothetical protein